MNFNQTLQAIQQELKAPKGQYNSFGKYKYRSCEDILEAVKPILAKYHCSLVISDEIVMVGNRIYVKATSTLSNGECEVSASAFAREEETKKGADASQVTGATSSYARKYALNGLFCIDDTKDADATNTHGQDVGGSGKVQTAATAVSSQNVDDDNLSLALDEIKRATTTSRLTEIYNSYEGFRSVSKFMNALSARRKEIERR